MKIKILFIALFTLISCVSLQAQTPEDLINKNLINLSIPENKSVKSFSMDLTIITESGKYLSQIRFDNGKLAFNCLDKDSTPLLVARDSNIVFNDALNTKVCLLKQNIMILKAVFENNQLNANFNFHQPNEEEKTNIIKVDFLELAKQAMKNLKSTKEKDLITIVGTSEKNSSLISVINPKDSFPLKKMTIDCEDFKVVFDNIKVNSSIDESVFIFKEQDLMASGIVVDELTKNQNNNILENMQMLQNLMVAAMVRTAFNEPDIQDGLNKMIGSDKPIDWAHLKAVDVIKSAKLRRLFKAF